MSHCHDEAHGHAHGHGHGHGGHDHDHDHDEAPDSGLVHESLYQKIDHDNVVCLNEAEADSGKSVLKPWHEKMDDTKFVESDADEQLILRIPFTGLVKLKSISIRAEPGESAPRKMKAFANKDDLDFDNADSTAATQEWDLVEDTQGQIAEYSTRVAKFTSIRSLTLFFNENFGGDTTKITFIGLKGEFSEFKRDPIITVYELQANPADHKVPGINDILGHQID
ncbi:PITH domain-containing protein 1 [Dissophora globulifera]|uniref:PITH domain-containing protein 1 n=1 Tax=Dissophora globulifera TaxID=979702 RepID=A0A9P6UUK7_9FUNG|nr:PITH domain-containing protein 1 [Dissophora globulifera]